MKVKLSLVTAIITLCLTSVLAQTGQHGDDAQGPHFEGEETELIGTNQSFSATMEYQIFRQSGDNVTMSGKFSFDHGKSRLEMNTSEMQGSKILPGAIRQLKSMGMNRMLSITRPDLKLAYIIYPDLKTYAVITQHDPFANATAGDFKVETTVLGKETMEGHECVKVNIVAIDKDGNKHEATGWKATDLKSFPVKIVTNKDGQSLRMLFKNISFDKPAASSFELPSGLITKYDDVETMIRTEIIHQRSVK